MKHIIAKSFLFAKEGEEVKIDIGNNRFKQFVRNEPQGNLTLYVKYKSELQQYIDEGWIKIREPLEGWVNEYQDGNQFNLSEKVWQNREDAERNHGIDYTRTVHFIEAE